MEINLEGLEGQYKVVVNSNISSEGSDYGYATVSQSTTAPAYNINNTTNSRFIYISGNSTVSQTPTDRESTIVLEGGNIYYLHLGYRKDGSVDTGDDQFVVNSVKLYEATTSQYNFEEAQVGEGEETRTVYQSTNQGKDGKVSNSYIPIDLSDYVGKYNITVNAEISTASGDYGYVTVNKTQSPAPTYNSNTTDNQRFVYITGNQSAQDYTLEVDGGFLYYLHLGYYKDSTANTTGDDIFTVNSVNVSLSGSELYHTTVETNSEGQAITQIPFGKYSITETTAPDGYIANEEPTIVEFRSTEGAQHEFTIENEKLCHVTVHHYIKGTDTKLAEDEIIDGRQNEDYETLPLVDLERYELEIDGTTGEQILPSNRVGKFTYEDTDVNYYYVPKQIPLIVHHYIEGTTQPVPLANGNSAEDIETTGNENEEYSTEAISNDNLSEEYELSETPENATGTYQYPQVEVTYYYKKIVREYTINKYKEDGQTPLEGVEFYISPSDEINIVKVGKLTQNGDYYFEKDGTKYVSNNTSGTGTANSYIEIDLSRAIKDTEVKINAQKSGYGYGYATISESTDAPAYNINNSANKRFIYISSTTSSAQDYSTTLAPGKVYYLHLGYYKSNSSSYGTNTFTINSLTIEGAKETQKALQTTDSNGQIKGSLEVGTYNVSELEAPEGYVLLSDIDDIVINRETSNLEANIINQRQQGKIIVRHLIEGTENQVPSTTPGQTVENEIKNGYVGDIYATKPSENVAPNYEVVSEDVENQSGTYTADDITVTYYYRIKEPIIENSNITKTSTLETINRSNQVIPYTISYSANVDEYIGNGIVTIVDSLPAHIDTENSNIAGGTYNEDEKTITWTEEVNDINTYENGEKQVTITKQISLVYTDLDETENTVENNVTGKLKLNTPEKEDTVTAEKEIDAEYQVDLTVNKVWVDNEIQALRRPNQVKLQVKNGNTVVQEYVLNTQTENSHEFTGLAKYDASKQEIVYTIDELEVNNNDMKFYEKQLGTVAGEDEKIATVTNTFKVAPDKTSVNQTRDQKA